MSFHPWQYFITSCWQGKVEFWTNGWTHPSSTTSMCSLIHRGVSSKKLLWWHEHTMFSVVCGDFVWKDSVTRCRGCSATGHLRLGLGRRRTHWNWWLQGLMAGAPKGVKLMPQVTMSRALRLSPSRACWNRGLSLHIHTPLLGIIKKLDIGTLMVPPDAFRLEEANWVSEFDLNF